MASTQMDRVYAFIQATLHRQGYPPSFEEIGQACRLHRRQVLSSLWRLEKAGRLRFRPDLPRSLRLHTEG